MSIKLQYDLEFQAGIYLDDRLQLNSYMINLQLCTNTTNTAQINIAIARLKCFVYVELADTVFINRGVDGHGEMLSALGVNVTTLPEDPIDQIVGIMLYCKLNAIMEGRVTVTSLHISSKLGDGVWYQYDEEDKLGVFSADNWWHLSSVQHNSIDQDILPDNVVHVEPNAWIEYGLMWPEAEPVPANQTANTVVFANFSKNEDR